MKNQGMSFLSEFNPELTEYEKKLVEDANVPTT